MGYKEYLIEGMNIKVSGKVVDVVKPDRANDQTLVYVNVRRFDKAISREKSYYIGKGGSNGIGSRYEMFGMYINGGEIEELGIPIDPHDEIESPEVYVDDEGRVSFTNGRHRWAWLRDQGIKRIPVTMPKECVKNAKKYKYI